MALPVLCQCIRSLMSHLNLHKSFMPRMDSFFFISIHLSYYNNSSSRISLRISSPSILHFEFLFGGPSVLDSLFCAFHSQSHYLIFFLEFLGPHTMVSGRLYSLRPIFDEEYAISCPEHFTQLRSFFWFF